MGLRPRPDSADDGVDLFVREHATRTARERRHRRTWHPVGGGPSNRGIVGDRQENGIAKRNCCSSIAVRTVASRTVVRVEDVELQNPVGRNYLGFRPRPTGRVVKGAGHNRERGEREKRGRMLHRRPPSSLLFSSIAPGASTPARMAKGACCQVLTRSCFETTMPATTPNPI